MESPCLNQFGVFPAPTTGAIYLAPATQIHWIHFNHSMREPSMIIPVTAAVDDDGLVHIEGDGLHLVRWNHRPAVVHDAVHRFGGHGGAEAALAPVGGADGILRVMSAARGWIGEPQPTRQRRSSHYSRMADKF